MWDEEEEEDLYADDYYLIEEDEEFWDVIDANYPANTFAELLVYVMIPSAMFGYGLGVIFCPVVAAVADLIGLARG